jgi:hypothetical protein
LNAAKALPLAYCDTACPREMRDFCREPEWEGQNGNGERLVVGRSSLRFVVG